MAEQEPLPTTREDYPNMKQALLLVLMLFAFQILAHMFIQGIAGERADRQAIIDLIVVNSITFTLVVVWAIDRTGLRARDVIALKPFPPMVLPPLVITIIGASVVISEIDNLVRRFVPMPDELMKMMEQLFQAGPWSLVALVVVAPLTEEIFFRGVILRGLLRNRSAAKAILLSSLLFAFIHLNPYQAISAFGVGCLLGWLYFRTGSLWPSILGHAFLNGMGWLVADVFRLRIPGYTLPADPAVVQFQPLWFDAVGLLALGVGLLGLHVAMHRDAPPEAA